MLNVDGKADNNYDIQVGAGANVNIQVTQGNINMAALDGDINMFANNNMNISVGGTYKVMAGKILETSTSTTTRSAQNEYHTYGDPVDHN